MPLIFLPNELIPNGLTDLLGKRKSAALISCPRALLFFEVVLSTYLAVLIKASQPAVCAMQLEVFSEARRWKGVHFNNTQKHELETSKKLCVWTESKSQITNCKDRNAAGGFVGPVKRWCFSAREPALGRALTAQDLKTYKDTVLLKSSAKVIRSFVLLMMWIKMRLPSFARHRWGIDPKCFHDCQLFMLFNLPMKLILAHYCLLFAV